MPEAQRTKGIDSRAQFKLKTLATSLATCIATLPMIALLTSTVAIELLTSSARVTFVQSAKPLVLTQIERLIPIDRTWDTWVR